MATLPGMVTLSLLGFSQVLLAQHEAVPAAAITAAEDATATAAVADPRNRDELLDDLLARWAASDSVLNQRHRADVRQLRSSHAQTRARLTEQLDGLASQYQDEQRRREQAELIRAQLGDENRRFVRELAQQDPGFAARIREIRQSLTSLSQTPAGTRALQLFAAGKEQQALALLDQGFNDFARQSDQQNRVALAYQARDIAVLALDALARSRTSIEAVIRRFESIVDLDPTYFPDHLLLSRLYEQRGELEKAIAYANSAAEHAGKPRETALARQQIADLYLLNGEPDKARESYQGVLTLTQQLLQQAAEDERRLVQRDLAIVYARLGDVHFELRDWADAQAFYQQHLEQLDLLIASQPANDDLLRERGLALMHLGQVLVSQQQLTAAAGYYRVAQQGLRSLLEKNPDRVEWQGDQALLWQQQAELALQQEQTAVAIEQLQQAGALWQQLIAQDVGQARWRLNAARVEAMLGDLARERAQLSAAATHYSTALQRLVDTSGAAPAGAYLQRERARLQARLAALAMVQAQLPEAAGYYAAAIGALGEIAHRSDYDNEALLQYLLHAGNLLFRQGSFTEAREHYQRAQTVHAEIDYALLDPQAEKQDLRSILLRLGDANFALQLHDDTRRAYEQALQLSQAISDDQPAEQAIHQYLAEAYLKLGRVMSADQSYERASKYFESCVLEAQQSLTAAADDKVQELLASCLYRQAESLQLFGQWKPSLAHLQQAIEVRRKRAGSEQDRDNQRAIALCYDLLGDGLLADKRYRAAREHYHYGLAIRESLLEPNPDDRQLLRDISISNEKIGDVFLARIPHDLFSGHKYRDKARPFLQRSYEIRQQLLQQDPTPTRHKDVWLAMQRLVDDKHSGISWADMLEKTRELDALGLIGLQEAAYVEHVRKMAGQ